MAIGKPIRPDGHFADMSDHFALLSDHFALLSDHFALLSDQGDRDALENREAESGTGSGKRARSDIVKLGGPADVRAIFNRARHFDFGPPFAGDPDRKRKAGQVRYC